MNTVTSPAAASDLRLLLGPIQESLDKVEELLRKELRSPHPPVDELVRYGCLLGGKRLRPVLMLLVAKACGEIRPDHITLATVVEMIHTATLVHDDVLDDASQRRHLATVNARWGNESSVLLGDFLFTHAFYLASTLDNTFACRTIGRSTNLVCEGELRQIATRGRFELTEAEYLEIIEAKTAELCACSARLGAHYAGINEEGQERMDRFGRSLGIAFQIADDLLDITGDEQTTGKSLGSDLAQQKPTLPVIHALEVASPAERETMLELLAEPTEAGRPAELAEWLERFDAVEYTRRKALAYAQEARDQLRGLPDSEAKDVLSLITEFVVRRSH